MAGNESTGKCPQLKPHSGLILSDPKGNESTYSYGSASAMLRLATITSDGVGTVGYTYNDYGAITGISRDTTYYVFTYDDWGNVIDTKVGNIVLSTNHYDGYGRLERVTCGNGFVTEYVYDELDRVSEINQGTAGSLELAYKFIYNGEGDLYELRHYKTLRSTFFEYDHAGRCMSCTEKSFTVSGSTVTYTGTISGYRYEYDANNNLTKLTCIAAGSNWSTTYYYDDDNRPTTASLQNGATVTNSYDALNRLTSRLLTTGSATLTTTLTYLPGANGSKTGMIASYQNGTDDAYTYTGEFMP